jgi:SAM-dependent methyltransferase
MIHVLSTELFGESLAIPDMDTNRDITGIGMTDWGGYALPLAEKFSYKNTYYHQEPKLDITDPDLDPALHGTADFIISSDVFEHIAPPISVAFENLSKLLKPKGVVVFSVPYGKQDKTIEHFPELYNYRIIKKKGSHILKNVTREGVIENFDNLTFHGGQGATLEMRFFSESSLIEEFTRVGLGDVTIYDAPDFRHGIYSKHWKQGSSLPMSAQRPKA